MQPTVTYVMWLVCLLVTTMSCAKTAEAIEMPFGGLDLGRFKESCIRWGPGSPTKWAIWGHLPAHCEIKGISSMSQSYSIGACDIYEKGVSGAYAAEFFFCCHQLFTQMTAVIKSEYSKCEPIP